MPGKIIKQSLYTATNIHPVIKWNGDYFNVEIQILIAHFGIIQKKFLLVWHRDTFNLSQKKQNPSKTHICLMWFVRLSQMLLMWYSLIFTTIKQKHLSQQNYNLIVYRWKDYSDPITL